MKAFEAFLLFVLGLLNQAVACYWGTQAMAAILERNPRGGGRAAIAICYAVLGALCLFESMRCVWRAIDNEERRT